MGPGRRGQGPGRPNEGYDVIVWPSMTWQVAVFVTFRVLSALPALRWPLGGGLFAIVADFSDLFLMNAIGGIEDYQRLDKLCDLAYMLVFLRVAPRWDGLR